MPGTGAVTVKIKAPPLVRATRRTFVIPSVLWLTAWFFAVYYALFLPSQVFKFRLDLDLVGAIALVLFIRFFVPSLAWLLVLLLIWLLTILYIDASESAPVRPDFGYPLKLATVLVLGSLGIDILAGWKARRELAVRRTATEADNALCWQCGYRLLGLAEEGRCPECGWRYDDLEQVRKAWEAWQPKRGPRWVPALGSLIARVIR